MEQEILKMAMTQGLWAVLSIFLIFYIIQVQKTREANQEKRENNYRELIESLINKMELLNNVNDTVIQIKEELDIDRINNK